MQMSQKCQKLIKKFINQIFNNLKLMLKIGVSVILIFICIVTMMKLFSYMNKGNVILFIFGILGVFLTLGLILESKVTDNKPI